MKICCDCKRRKPLKKFYRNAARRDGRQTFCIDCNAARRRKDRAANACRDKAYSRKYYARNATRLREAGRRWARENPGLALAKCRRRDAALLRATPAWADLEKIARIYVGARRRGLHVDHIVPLRSPIVCGLHVHNNLKPVTERANKTKSNRRWPGMPTQEMI